MEKNKYNFLQKYCVVRTEFAGIHVGVVQYKEGNEVILSNARRIWSWDDAFTLSEVAEEGISQKSKLSITLSQDIWVLGVTEIIICTDIAEGILRALKPHRHGTENYPREPRIE
jgi:hypothetical protein